MARDVQSAALLDLKALPALSEADGKDLGKRWVHDPALALSMLVQVLVARAFDPTIKSFGSDFRPQSKM